MKNKVISKSPDWSATSGIVVAVVGAASFWISEIYAAYFVSGAEMGSASKGAGALCLGLFGALFVAHLFRPWSKAAAILGLVSLAVYAGFVAYQASPCLVFIKYLPSFKSALLTATALGVAGIGFDIERCWRLCSLTLSESLWLQLGHKVRAELRHTFHPNHLQSL